MKANMGSADRIIRILLAIVIGVLYFSTDYLSGTLGIILLIVGGIFLLTSLVSYCPAYVPIKLSTKKKK